MQRFGQKETEIHFKIQKNIVCFVFDTSNIDNTRAHITHQFSLFSFHMILLYNQDTDKYVTINTHYTGNVHTRTPVPTSALNVTACWTLELAEDC